MEALTLFVLLGVSIIVGQVVFGWKSSKILPVFAVAGAFIILTQQGVIPNFLGLTNSTIILAPVVNGTQTFAGQPLQKEEHICNQGTYSGNKGLCVYTPPTPPQFPWANNNNAQTVSLTTIPKNIPKGTLQCTKINGEIKWNTCKQVK